MSTKAQSVQRSSALDIANDRRIKRAAFKRELRAAPTREESRALLAGAVRTRMNDPAISHARVAELLLSVKGFADGNTRSILRRIRATDVRRVGELTERQVSLLLDELDNWGSNHLQPSQHQ